MAGEIAIVTGSAMGIGRYVAHRFAQDGARVVLADVDEKGLANVSSEIKAMGAEVLAVKTDVRDDDSVRKMASQVAQQFGRIDILVNDAGIVPHFQWGNPRWPKIRDQDKAFWDKVIDTNLGGTMLCTKHVLPYMEEQRSGHIINLYGGGNGTGACAYVVSKDAIKTFTRFVAEEEREFNVCIVVMGPGGTIATENAPEEARQRMPGPDIAGDRFILGSKAPMEMAGHLLDVKDGQLVVVS